MTCKKIFFAMCIFGFSLCAMERDDDDPHGTKKRLKQTHNFWIFAPFCDTRLQKLYEDWKAGGNLVEYDELNKELNVPQEIVGHTLFGYAVITYDNPQFIKYLIKMGASVSTECNSSGCWIGSRNSESHSVVLDIAQYGNPETLQLFIKHGALGAGEKNNTVL